MALFRCNNCCSVYDDNYPPDDTCIECNKGAIRIINVADHTRSALFYFKEATP